ncbi:hypothetical protein EV368DRAFT_65737 [Lentinula lateritia]|uniref:Uncharacterized protein n=1 Tax=Lentinula aff. lateritia TaxID=2804960 RepID=A0ACC1TLT2_9AGAR|nr:hypothetical protein F5876DRAFT_69631 [Lentinula aff. lateritia]KAJ3851458.1 hypothetical protein EV368DRAFT_65737 [Lentinula lateritia]
MVHSKSLLAALVAVAGSSFALAIPIQGTAGVFSMPENGVPRTNFIPPPASVNPLYRRNVIDVEEAEGIDIDSGEEPYWRYHHDEKLIPVPVKELPEQLLLASPHTGEEEVRLSLDISRSSPSELSRRASNSVGDKELTEAGTLTYPDTNGVYQNIKLVGVQKLKPDGIKALKAYISSISMNNGGVLLESDYSRNYILGVYPTRTFAYLSVWCTAWEVKFGLRIARKRPPDDEKVEDQICSRRNGRERAYEKMIATFEFPNRAGLSHFSGLWKQATFDILRYLPRSILLFSNLTRILTTMIHSPSVLATIIAVGVASFVLAALSKALQELPIHRTMRHQLLSVFRSRISSEFQCLLLIWGSINLLTNLSSARRLRVLIQM